MDINLVGSDGREIIDDGSAGGEYGGDDNPNDNPDWVLIAAAPELLDACKAMVAAMDSTFEDLLLAKFQAIEAIKKAEGKS